MTWKMLVVSCVLTFSLFSYIGMASEVTINPDKTISINGKKTFPVGIYGLCNQYPSVPMHPCSEGFDKLYAFSWTVDNEFWNGPDTSFWRKNIPLFESNKHYWTVRASVASSPIFQSEYTKNYFVGYVIDDEPSTEDDWAKRNSQYETVKTYDHSYPAYIPNYKDMKRSGTVADIILYDGYYHAQGGWASNYALADFIYRKEYEMWKNFIKSGCSECTGLESSNGPVWAVTEAWGKETGFNSGLKFYPLSAAEARADAYFLISLGVKGIEWWGYQTDDVSATIHPVGIVGETTLIAQYNKLATEIRSLEQILLLPTKNYSWQYRVDNAVTFNNNPTKFVIYENRKRLNYMLKQNESVYYLFVVNKDQAQTNTDVIIKELSGTGAMTARTLGSETTGSSRAGRILTVTNGKFVDSLDGYAVHIYEISPGAAGAFKYNANRSGVTLVYYHGYPIEKPSISSGREIFNSNCADCHGEKGDGSLLKGSFNFTDNELMINKSLSLFFNVVTKGVPGTAMPSFENSFRCTSRRTMVL